MKINNLIKFCFILLMFFSFSGNVFAVDTMMFTLSENASGVTKDTATIKILTLVVDSSDTTTKPVVDISVTDSRGVKTTKTNVSTLARTGATSAGAFDSTATFTGLLPDTTYTITAKATRGTWVDETVEVPSGTSQNFTTLQAVAQEWYFLTTTNTLSSAFPTYQACIDARGIQNPEPCTMKGTPEYSAMLTKSVEISSMGKVFKDEYKLLAPIGSFKVLNKDTKIGDYVNLMFKIFLGLCGALAVVMIVIYGIQWMGTDSVFGKTEAKQNIAGSIGGLVLALGAWMLLNTINPDLLGGGLSIMNAKITLDADVDGDEPHEASNGKYCNGTYSANQAWASDTTERAALNTAGVKINHPNNCTNVGDKDPLCTSVAGLNTAKVIAFKTACDAATASPNKCNVVITGGTECWFHSIKTNHKPGNSIVDIRFNGDENKYTKAYIESGAPSTITWKNGTSPTATMYTKNGARFVKESDHYHVKSW